MSPRPFLLQLHHLSKLLLCLAEWLSISLLTALLRLFITELVAQDSHRVNEAASFIHKTSTLDERIAHWALLTVKGMWANDAG